MTTRDVAKNEARCCGLIREDKASPPQGRERNDVSRFVYSGRLDQDPARRIGGASCLDPNFDINTHRR